MTWQHDNKQYKQVNFNNFFIEKIVSIFKFVFKFVNTLWPQYTIDFKSKISLALFQTTKGTEVYTSLPASVNFSTLGSFKRSITDVDFINFLKYA